MLNRTLLITLLCSAALAGPGSINGFVRDAASGEPLAYANVWLENTDHGAAAGDRGYYYIGGVEPGEYQLVASYIGYETARREVTVSADRTLTVNLELSTGSVKVDEVVVSAERAIFEREVEVSVTRLDTRQFQAMPRVGGEVDLLRTIQLLPGVIATSDFSNKLYIRGGSPDQNLVLLDGITVYNPAHLFGIFSPFVPEAVADATLHAGGFPAEYGGRLSSVLDVTTREGNSRRYTGQGSVSMLAATGIVEGPVPNGSFLVAGRRTYLPDVLLAAFGVEGIGYYFYDLMGKANYELNPDTRFTLAGLLAEDVLDFADPDDPEGLNARLGWGNRGVSVRSNLILNPTLYGEALVSWSNLYAGFDVVFEKTDTARLNTDLTDCLFKADFTWYAADRHTLDIGAEAHYLGMENRAVFDTFGFERADDNWPLAIYASDRWEITRERFFLQPGLRYAWYEQGNKHELEPRLGAKYRPAENTALSASFGRFTQPLVTLNSTDPVFAIYDVWQSVPADRPSPAALHFIAGVEQWLRRDVIFELEAWYKDYDNLLESRYGQFFTPVDSLLDADGWSSGLDLMLRRTEGWFNGWVSYSFMWTRRSIGDESYSPHYDRRHHLNVLFNLPALFWGTDLSARFTLGTGLPYSGAVGYFPRYEERPHARPWPEDPNWELIQGPRDAFRYPVYHRLDIGLTRQRNFKWGELSVFLDVINAYYARNVLLYFWDIEEGRPPERRQIDMLPILPTVGVKAKF